MLRTDMLPTDTVRADMLRTNLLDTVDLAVVFCKGTIASKEDLDVLRQAVRTKLAKANVVIDFSEIGNLGRETVEVLIELWHEACGQGSRLTIFNPSLWLYQELGKIRSSCEIAVLTDGEFLGLLRQGKALKARPSVGAAKHWGQRLSHGLRSAGLP